jgi:hypothetical protein
MSGASLDPGLLEDAIQCTWREIIGRLAGNCNTSAFNRMLELTVAAARRDEIPAVSLKHLDNIADLHRPDGIRAAMA